MEQKTSTFSPQHCAISNPAGQPAIKAYDPVPGKRHLIQGGISYGLSHDPRDNDSYLEIRVNNDVVHWIPVATKGPHFLPIADMATTVNDELKITLGGGGVVDGIDPGTGQPIQIAVTAAVNVIGYNLVA